MLMMLSSTNVEANVYKKQETQRTTRIRGMFVMSVAKV